MQFARRHSVESTVDSTGSAVRDFSAYHQYRLAQQTGDNNSNAAECGAMAAASKLHHPFADASCDTRDHLAPTELRQRVRIYFKYKNLFIHLILIKK